MRLFVSRDVDGFFGLFVDNLVQLLLIVGLCGGLCRMPAELLFGVILPGAALSILFGNVFYAFQAHRLAKKTGRSDVTALPYGINTPSLLVFVYFIIKPEFDRTGDPFAAWRLGLLACLGSGVIEILGAFVAGPLRRWTPRAALLSTLAGIAIGFISMTFALQIYQKPLIGLLPLAIVLFSLYSGIRLPGGLPGGFVAIVVGAGISWLMLPLQSIEALPAWATYGAASWEAVQASLTGVGWRPPAWSGPAVQQGWNELQTSGGWIAFLSIVAPMGLFNVIGSMQNIESAEAAGDSYSTAPSMLANGFGTVVAALLGSCFPTTIYIGHPGWKALGARAGYSTLNGLAIAALALFGVVGTAAAVIPLEAGAGIVLWIGIIITAQAFQTVPTSHAPAAAMGLFPAIAAWGATAVMGVFPLAGGATLHDVMQPQARVASASSPAAPAGAAEDDSEMTPTIAASQPSAAADDPSAAVIDAAELSSPEAALPITRSRQSEAQVNGFLLHGLLVMERGYIFACMILAALSVCLIERRLAAAGVWLLSAATLTFLGAMHAYQIPTSGVVDYVFRFLPAQADAIVYRGDDLALAYLLSGLFCLAIARWSKDRPVTPTH